MFLGVVVGIVFARGNATSKSFVVREVGIGNIGHLKLQQCPKSKTWLDCLFTMMFNEGTSTEISQYQQ